MLRVETKKSIWIVFYNWERQLLAKFDSPSFDSKLFYSSISLLDKLLRENCLNMVTGSNRISEEGCFPHSIFPCKFLKSESSAWVIKVIHFETIDIEIYLNFFLILLHLREPKLSESFAVFLFCTRSFRANFCELSYKQWSLKLRFF